MDSFESSPALDDLVSTQVSRKMGYTLEGDFLNDVEGFFTAVDIVVDGVHCYVQEHTSGVVDVRYDITGFDHVVNSRSETTQRVKRARYGAVEYTAVCHPVHQ